MPQHRRRRKKPDRDAGRGRFLRLTPTGSACNEPAVHEDGLAGHPSRVRLDQKLYQRDDVFDFPFTKCFHGQDERSYLVREKINKGPLRVLAV
jgi:hypothetical protein